MNYLTADESMLAHLRGIVEPVEIRDPSGNLLGHYTPALSPEEAALYRKAVELFDLEEAKEVAATEHHWLTIEEVMQYLHGLERKG